jgi:hypothetical protein
MLSCQKTCSPDGREVGLAVSHEDKPSVRSLALTYLAGHRVATLATSGSQGVWAAAVFYVNENFDLIFLSAESTRHIGNLSANPRAAATIQEDYEDWPDIKGIQMEGTVRVLHGRERAAAIAIYYSKYAFLRSAGAMVRMALEKVSWYRLTPDLLYFIDNSKGLGHRDEIDLESSGF